MVDAIQEAIAVQLGRYERVQPGHARTTGQQVGAAPLQLARAAAGQHEPQRRVPLDEQVDFVQQRRTLLDLVDHHDPPSRLQGLAQVLGMRAQLVKRVRFQQVVDRRVRERMADERALAGLAGPEQEDGAVLDEGAEIQGATVHPAKLLLIFMKFSNSIAGFQRHAPAAAPKTLQRRLQPLDDLRTVSYTHLTLPTKRIV